MREYRLTSVRLGRSEIEQIVVMTDRVSKFARNVFMGVSCYGAVKIECLSASRHHVKYLGFIYGVGFVTLEEFYERLIADYVNNDINPSVIEGVYDMIRRLKEFKED